VGEIWSDLDHRLIQDAQGELKKNINVAAVMTSIDNILRTYRGERVMLPTFASGLRGIVFEGLTPSLMKLTSREIRDTIETWDDRVKVQEVELLSDPDNSTLSISIEFVIKGLENIFKYETTIRGN
jgi:phage baseplate assembly protein W